MTSNIVNVIMHGVYAYVFAPDCIIAYTPAVRGHIYKAGGRDFVHAKPLRKGAHYKLTGVLEDSHQRHKPDIKHFPLLEISAEPMDEYGKRFCSFCLPYPAKIEGYDHQIFPLDAYNVGSIYTGKHCGTLNCMEECPSLLVFTYARKEEAVKLVPEGGCDEIVFDATPNNADVSMLNAHIWCTLSPIDMDHGGMSPDGHIRRAFNAMADLVPRLELMLQFPDGFSPTACDENLPAGVSKCDVDPGRKGCDPQHFGKVNCHYANLIVWPTGS